MRNDFVRPVFSFQGNIPPVSMFIVSSRDHCFRPFVCYQRNSTGKKIKRQSINIDWFLNPAIISKGFFI